METPARDKAKAEPGSAWVFLLGWSVAIGVLVGAGVDSTGVGIAIQIFSAIIFLSLELINDRLRRIIKLMEERR